MTQKDCFTIFQQLAIKMKKYKTYEYKNKKLTYRFIKGKARIIVECVVGKKNYNDVSCFYNNEKKCLYVKVFDVVFSFHQIDETDFILNKAAHNTPFTWPGIKLQWIAEDVFVIAKDLVVS